MRTGKVTFPAALVFIHAGSCRTVVMICLAEVVNYYQPGFFARQYTCNISPFSQTTTMARQFSTK
jgi:hypothetical protein